MEGNEEDQNFGIVNDTLLRAKMRVDDKSLEYNRKSELFINEEEGGGYLSETGNLQRRSSGVSRNISSARKGPALFVISSSNVFKRIFDCIMVLLVAFSCFSSIFYVAFEGPITTGEKVLVIIVECLFGIDLILNFFQEFVDPTTLEPVTNYIPIAKNYLSSFFIFDLIAVIPLQILGSNYYALKLFRIVRLPQLLSFVDSSRFSEILRSCFKGSTKDEQVEAQYFVLYMYKIFRLFLLDLIITYLLAMMMYIVSNELNDKYTKSTFLSEYKFKSFSTSEQVLRCMYFIMTTLTTVGYGDFYPYTTSERIFIIFVELIGVSFYSYIMGNFIEVISNYEKKVGVVDKGSELENWLTYLTRFNSNKPLDKELIDEIEEHFRYFWREYRLSSLSPDDPYLSSLPKFTRYNIVLGYLFGEVFYEFRSFFNEKKNYTRFKYDMAFGFLPRIFTSGKEIYTEDEDVEELYLIRKGIVSVGFTLKGKRHQAKDQGQGFAFGDFYIFKNKNAEFFFEAKTNVELIGITKEHFLSVTEKHPKKKEEMENRSAARYMAEIKNPVVEFRAKILKKFNISNAYEEIEIKDKAPIKVMESIKMEHKSSSSSEADAGKDLENTLDSVNQDLKEYDTKLLSFTEKYHNAFATLYRNTQKMPLH